MNRQQTPSGRSGPGGPPSPRVPPSPRGSPPRSGPQPTSSRTPYMPKKTGRETPDSISSEYPRPRTATPTGPRPSDPTNPNAFTTEYGWPVLGEPMNFGKKLTVRQMTAQRVAYICFVIAVNVGLAMAAVFGNTHGMLLAFVVFFKAKDIICVLIDVSGLLIRAIHRAIRGPPPETEAQWILSLIPTYNESEEQILKCIDSLRDNDIGKHKQVMCVVMDGKPKELRSEMDRVVLEYDRPYHTLKSKTGSLRVTAGWIHSCPVILIEKAKNCGKKDSLVLAHDIFNFPRDDMPLYSKLLREDIWNKALPLLTKDQGEFTGFDGVFCTDADSKLHKGCLRLLADALARDENAIAAAGTVFVELEKGYEWSLWNLYQQFQYTFGQYVRRRAEGFIGRVTCLPGCVTMIAVRKEMAGAIQKYAKQVSSDFILHHQVQNLGTDRRLTYAMLSQGTHLHTLFVPDAVSETVAPQSLLHYLSQRRRWGSNAHFNNYYLLAGSNMNPIIRLAALIDAARQTFIFYRIMNTVLFIKALVDHFVIWDILPLLIVGQLPLLWYLISMFIESQLRRRFFKLVLGFFINKIISPFLAVIIFIEVCFNLGNNVWGLSGITATSPPSTAASREIRDIKEGKIVAAEEGRGSPIPRAHQRPSSRAASVF
ncbi:chitin synthase-domain-containing protein [Podospora aff. communis PSN243]|uniref:chitin synthase n=1 Tax=Podospora aff. communis PSN243 TaxID=3040156 RepID=A0AAV9GTK7_9PEZI|nr:chitin synthase-domain-containing protein [Podospora aff. communis PSN243]